MNYTMIFEKSAQVFVEAFSAIINMKDFDASVKLDLNHDVKFDKYRGNLSLIMKQVNPTKSSIIINECKKPFGMGTI